MVPAVLPPGWPPVVLPPGSEGFERTAVGWLFDHCPAELRGYEVLRRHPVLLARLATEQLTAAVQACRDGYRTARADLSALHPPPEPGVVDALLAVYEREGRRLVAAVTAAGLVGRALRGERFVPRL